MTLDNSLLSLTITATVIAVFLLIGTVDEIIAPCCFPYDDEGYIDPSTGFYVGVSEVQNDSYLGLPFGNATYIFQFLDENNNVVLEKTETITDDLPIKSGFVIPPGLTFPFKVFVNDMELAKKIKSFQFAGTENLQYFSWKAADLIVSFDKIKLIRTINDYNTWQIQGTILNNHTQNTQNVYVLASIHQKDSHIIDVAGYSPDDKQPLELDAFESKNFTLYATIPINLKPESVEIYAESDNSSMMHKYYKPIIMKDATDHENKSTTDPRKPLVISANIINISREDLNFNWIIQIKKSPKSILEGDLSKDSKSKVEFIKIIPSQIDAQKSINLEYSWTPQSNGIYFYEMYAWDDYSKPLSYQFTSTFMSDNWLYVSSNLNSIPSQIKSGIPMDKIQCRENLQLSHKASNGNFICVKQDTLIRLIERGWTKPI